MPVRASDAKIIEPNGHGISACGRVNNSDDKGRPQTGHLEAQNHPRRMDSGVNNMNDVTVESKAIVKWKP